MAYIEAVTLPIDEGDLRPSAMVAHGDVTVLTVAIVLVDDAHPGPVEVGGQLGEGLVHEVARRVQVDGVEVGAVHRWGGTEEYILWTRVYAYVIKLHRVPKWILGPLITL